MEKIIALRGPLQVAKDRIPFEYLATLEEGEWLLANVEKSTGFEFVRGVEIEVFANSTGNQRVEIKNPKRMSENADGCLRYGKKGYLEYAPLKISDNRIHERNV